MPEETESECCQSIPLAVVHTWLRFLDPQIPRCSLFNLDKPPQRTLNLPLDLIRQFRFSLSLLPGQFPLLSPAILDGGHDPLAFGFRVLPRVYLEP